MGEPVFDAVAYKIAYQFGIAVGIGHTEAVRHATLAAYARERGSEGFARIARAIRDLDDAEA